MKKIMVVLLSVTALFLMLATGCASKTVPTAPAATKTFTATPTKTGTSTPTPNATTTAAASNANATATAAAVQTLVAQIGQVYATQTQVAANATATQVSAIATATASATAANCSGNAFGNAAAPTGAYGLSVGVTYYQNIAASKLTGFTVNSIIAQNVVAVIYADNAGSTSTTGALLAQSSETACTAGTNTITLGSPIELAAGNYWIGFIGDGNFGTVMAADGGGTSASQTGAPTMYTGWAMVSDTVTLASLLPFTADPFNAASGPSMCVSNGGYFNSWLTGVDVKAIVACP